MDILIYAKPEVVEHKMKERIKKGYHCNWIVSQVPASHNIVLIDKVYFSDGKKIFAEGNYIGNDFVSKKAIAFEPLKRVNKKQPKKPPTRGWCYINV